MPKFSLSCLLVSTAAFYLVVAFSMAHLFPSAGNVSHCTVFGSRYCVFRLLEIFGFVELHSPFFLHLQNGLDFFAEISKVLSNFQWNHFGTLLLKFWNICASANCDNLVLHTIYKFADMVWNSKLHWVYCFINEDGYSFQQLVLERTPWMDSCL